MIWLEKNWYFGKAVAYEVIDYYFSRYMQQLLVGSCYKYDVSARSSATAVSESCTMAIIRPLQTVVL